MIQLEILPEGNLLYQKIAYLDLADKWIAQPYPDTKWVLGELICQYTGFTQYNHMSTNWDNSERYVTVDIRNWPDYIESNTWFKIGTTNNPLGFYDFNLYQNTSGGNQDPTGLNILYAGTINAVLSPTNDNGTATTPTVEYKEYTNNDADTNSIYLTNDTV
tara:strand:+ start:1508 stop:1990 length:483 start_codon:yes stop_codon:yes gene_type:complete